MELQLFSEAKSFGKECFLDDDFDRMMEIAETFPCSIIVFATMKEASELSKGELKKLRRFAEWGREFDKDRQKTRVAVIMLTGTELFCEHHLKETYREKKGKHAQLVEPPFVHVDNLRHLADITQQLYLDLPSYWEWHHKRKVRRMKGRRTASA
ncbi:MAG: hypothetical protein PW734_01370 [Verrucomicrobium sp.]|nr:hypothetical protein [Verrucomicrobium sp.]